ncbi:DUF6153 family protein [Streptomyces lavendulae]|uniref:DUF6153 family protein n=1 Tax=Streptomyces lavendulae TaxID=1914 RepID=UPI0033C3D84C
MQRLRFLLIIGIAIGVLGMHALGSADALRSADSAPHPSRHMTAPAAGPQCTCRGDDHGPDRQRRRADRIWLSGL